MKRSLLFSVVFVLLLTSFVAADSWSWWAPTVPKSSPSWDQLLWMNIPLQGGSGSNTPLPPQTNPVPPLRPIQPEKPVSPPSPPVPSLTADEQALINQVNQERLKNGLNILQVDSSLVALAKQKSRDLAENGYFDHVSPTLGTVYNMLDRAGIDYKLAGENIARTGSFARIHPLFMGSSGHRANIVYSGYTHFGVGIVLKGQEYNVTQIFIKK